MNPVDDNQAIEFMHRGIALFNTGAPDALREAVRCFDQAIELRRRLPVAEDPAARYKLAAGLINRGDALVRLGGPDNAAEAVKSHTEAIGLLEKIPPDADALYIKRLAIAWMNRGAALELTSSPSALGEAIRSLEKAIALLDGSPHSSDPEITLVAAAARINLGSALLRFSGDSAAPAVCESAGRALELLASSKAGDLLAADAGLKARHVLCQGLIAMLSKLQPGDDSTRLDLTGRITDAVEEGLRITREWGRKGVTGFHPIATQLFHVGTLVYERSQPQFLADFLLDHLDPERPTCLLPVDQNWVAFAEESLARVRGQFDISNFRALATDAGARNLETLAALREAQERLAALRGA